MNRTLALLLLSASIATVQAASVQVPLTNPVTLTIVVDAVELVEEGSGLAVGSDRPHVSRYRFLKPIQVEATVVRRVEAGLAVVTALN